MFLALAKPSTAGAALKMIEEEGFDMGVDIDDELSDLLIAKDDKGKSKLLELIAASEKEEACGRRRSGYGLWWWVGVRIRIWVVWFLGF